jgi:hypothetical protein
MRGDFKWYCTNRGEHKPRELDRMTWAPFGSEKFVLWDPKDEPKWEDMHWIGDEQSSRQQVETEYKKGRPVIRKHVTIKEVDGTTYVCFRCQSCRLSEPLIISEMALKAMWEEARRAGKWKADISE